MKAVVSKIVSALLLFRLGSSFADIIPPERRITWEGNVGIPGGIPKRTTVAAAVNADTCGNGKTDATTVIQNALDACPPKQVVLLSAGIFRIDGQLRIPSDVTLRGAGPSQTILDAHGKDNSVIAFGKQDGAVSGSRSIAITGGTTKGSRTITVADAANITVGSYLMISELNDPSFVSIQGTGGDCRWADAFWEGTRALGQIVEVTSVAGTTLGIAPGLYIDYPAKLSPLATYFSAGAKNAGLEDLQLYMNNTGYTANVMMYGCAYCWIRNIEGNFADGDHARLFFCFRCEVRDSYFHDAYRHIPGRTDADLFVAHKSSGILVENNCFWRLHCSVMLNWGASGNVVAYNYSDGNWHGPGQWLIYDLGFHAPHPMFNLWEGNVAVLFEADATWGSSSHNTVFRNRFKGATTVYPPLQGRGPVDWAHGFKPYQDLAAMELEFAARYYNLVGNVVGSDYIKENHGTSMVVWPEHRSYDYTGYDFSFGFGIMDDGRPQKPGRPGNSRLPFTTALLHGNYDWVTGRTLWDAAITDHTLPASLYRSSKPDWWGDLPWPPIGPDVTPMTNKIPAQRRFESLVPQAAENAGAHLP